MKSYKYRKRRLPKIHRPESSGKKKVAFAARQRFEKLTKSINIDRLHVIGTSQAFKFVIMIVLALVLATVAYSFVNLQLKELREIHFSRNLQQGLYESDMTGTYQSPQMFTLAVIVQGFDEENRLVEGFTIIRLDADSGSATVFSLPVDVYIPLTGEPRGATTTLDITVARIRDLMIIGDLQNPPMPLAYALYEIEELLAVNLDGYVYVPASLTGSIGEFSNGSPLPGADVEVKGHEDLSIEWSEYWAKYLSSVSLVRVWASRQDLPGIESNMEVLDVYRFLRDFGQVPEAEVRMPAVEGDLIREQIDERGEIIEYIDSAAIDEILSGQFSDERMEREQARIEIFNGTNIDGLGSRYQRWVNHLGGDVIRVKNAPGKVQETVVYVTDLEEYAYTLGRVKSLWEDVQVIEGRPGYVTTGDIIIVLGMDF